MRKPVPSAAVLALMPIAVRTRVEELVASLTRTSSATLEAIIAFGSVVRGGFNANHSDVDLVVIVNSDRPELLEVMAPALRLARAAARIECVLLTTAEIARGADVFPLWFEDMRACHSVLWGRDVFADLVIQDEHKRLRIEQELREARIRLRASIISEAVDDTVLAAMLARTTHRLRSPLHALLVLKANGSGKKIADDFDAVLRAAGDAWQVNPALLFSPQRDARAALRVLAGLLDAAIADVDSLGVSATGGGA